MPAQSRKIVNVPQAPAPSPAAVTTRAARAVQPAGALAVSSPTDAAEVEAQSTARRVVQMPASRDVFAQASAGRLQRSAALIPQSVHRSSSTPSAPSAVPQVSTAAASEIAGSGAAGRPLPGDVRGFMEPRFGAD